MADAEDPMKTIARLEREIERLTHERDMWRTRHTQLESEVVGMRRREVQWEKKIVASGGTIDPGSRVTIR